MRRCLRPTGETAPLCERWAGKMTFDNLRIRTKLNLFVLLVMVCVAAAGVTIAAGVKSELVSGRIDELRAITESAKGLAANLQDQVAAGGLTREQAEQAFARQLAVMTYDHGQGYVFAYRMDGVAVAAPDLKAIGTNRLDALFNGRPVIREIRDAVQNSGEAVIYYNFPRAGETTAIPKVSYAVTFPAWNLFLGTGAYIDDLTAKFHTAALAIGVGVGAMALLIGGAAWFVSQRISNPLGRLQACMRRLAAGEVDLDVPEMRRRDEVGDMARRCRSSNRTRRTPATGGGDGARTGRRRSRTRARRHRTRQRRPRNRRGRAPARRRPQESRRRRPDVRLGDGFAAAYAQIRHDFNEAVEKLKETLLRWSPAPRDRDRASNEISAASDDCRGAPSSRRRAWRRPPRR